MDLLQGILGAVSAMQGGQNQQASGNPMLNAVLGMLANSGQAGSASQSQMPGASNMGASGGMGSSGGMGALGALGGLGALVSAFQGAGLGKVVESWIGTGQNMPINGDQMQQALGRDKIADIAQQLGLSPKDTAGQLSSALPQIIDMLTPQGKAPQGGLGDIGSIIGMLQKGLSR
jgi:uncharacterized protein YidB (DUF937 family)